MIHLTGKAWQGGEFGLSPRGSVPRGLWIKLREFVNWDEEIHFYKLTSN